MEKSDPKLNSLNTTFAFVSYYSGILFVFVALAILISAGYLFRVKLQDSSKQVARNSGLETVKVQIYSGDERLEVSAEVADSDSERAIGLMNRESLYENSGMLFIFDNDIGHSFWMKNTLIPLDMIFVGQNNVIVDIIEDAQPCEVAQCPVYTPNSVYRYVLEVNGGWTGENGVVVGDFLEF